MTAAVKNGVLTIGLEGRIDHSNADELGSELSRILSEYDYDSIVLDAENLLYLSSAGLRVILSVRKKSPGLRIINASDEVYSIFLMTGFTEMMPIERAMKRLSVEGCPVLGRGAKGTVYRYNEDTIVKVYRDADSLPDAKRERELARRAFVLEIPTAISYDIVRVGDSYGSVFELLDATPYTKLIAADPEHRSRYIADYAALLRKLHGTKVRREDMPDIKDYVLKWVGAAAAYLQPEETEKLNRLIDETPDTLTMIHGDYHTNNVMLQNGETILIDMDTLSHGHPVFELAGIYITYVGFGIDDPHMVEDFLGIPYALATGIWEEFLPAYLGTDDQKVIEDVARKAILLATLRRLRHTARRPEADTPSGKKIIGDCVQTLRQLLPLTDTLAF